MFRKNIISIDIGTYAIKIIVGKTQKNNVIIHHAFTIPTPSESYKNGYIKNKKALKEVIYAVLLKNKVKAKRAVCTLDSTTAITRELVFPYVKPEELGSIVQLEIEQYLPIRFDEYVIEYKILEEFSENDIKKLRVLIAALPKEIVESYLSLVNDLGLKPIALDIHANAIAKAFENKFVINNENYNLDQTVALIDIGYEYMHIAVIDKGILRFNRLIQQGGRNVDTDIANAFNLSLIDAAKRKIEYASLKKSTQDYSSANMLNELIQSNINIWVQEIEKIFQYYTSRARGNRIDKIYLYGGSSNIPDLSTYISSIINIPTFKIDTMSNIKFKESNEQINLGEYINTISALIGR
ncbi:type IV pilus assembly protein PilM [Crassaminicella indica]|uniref:Pilus assembly protein PilM n=1 Tax=Crassaminicella indica TaxID=2855394 RepID=A0ABX8RB27_9CLOT|nr:type IV pilus assembly protein PilM [Crassaminicella indica]QXM05996.1 pilus assembly protein PilM [Crassaminicella indica]